MDFSTLKYNITLLKEDECVIDRWPELEGVLEFASREDDYYLRAVILMVSEGSPFVIKERDFRKIVESVFRYLDPKDTKTPKILLEETPWELRSIEDHQILKQIKEMIFAFFVFTDNHAYAVWYSKMMDFYYTLAFLQSPPNIEKPDHFEKRTKVNKALPELHKSLDEYERLIFPNDVVRKIIKEQTTKTITFAERHAQSYGTI